MNHQTIKSIGDAFAEISEAFNLSTTHQVHHDNASTSFAKEYTKAHKGEHRIGGPTAQDQKHSDEFYSNYKVKHTRHGFAGSGTSVYTCKKTGARYEVNRTPNGQGFHGTDHRINKL